MCSESLSNPAVEHTRSVYAMAYGGDLWQISKDLADTVAGES
jgi:hypothetical protein